MFALSSGSEILIIAEVAFILCAGYLILNFWREILLGTFSVFIIGQLLKEKIISAESTNVIQQELILEPKKTKITSKVIEEEFLSNAHIKDEGGIELNNYINDCISLTQKKELCQEIENQLE